MKVINRSRGGDVANNVKVAKGLRERCIGLIGKQRLQPGEGLFIIGCSSIHTFFMRFPIDVIFLDDHNRIVKLVENLRPYRIFIGPLSARSVLELPLGTIQRLGIHIGDELLFIE